MNRTREKSEMKEGSSFRNEDYHRRNMTANKRRGRR